MREKAVVPTPKAAKIRFSRAKEVSGAGSSSTTGWGTTGVVRGVGVARGVCGSTILGSTFGSGSGSGALCVVLDAGAAGAGGAFGAGMAS